MEPLSKQCGFLGSVVAFSKMVGWQDAVFGDSLDSAPMESYDQMFKSIEGFFGQTVWKDALDKMIRANVVTFMKYRGAACLHAQRHASRPMKCWGWALWLKMPLKMCPRSFLACVVLTNLDSEFNAFLRHQYD